ncbi:MAG: S8 family serine peptidase, partial [Candidatus Peregrinibacteria bacterium]|nr:S8 family serine peptidase [Candidatus Peregrinibacteria bacterium]
RESNCDAEFSFYKAAIDAAVAQNISVLFSSGNDGNSTAIGAPACISNATPISSTTKADVISSFSNRNGLLKLFATGGTNAGSNTCSDPNNPSADYICSTGYEGGYLHMSGTSMASPMVAGAIAIINQYLNLIGQTRTPSQIEDILYDTGLQFNENSNNFSRIDVYSAILSLDADAPNVTLVSPADNRVNLTSNQTFTCNATDWQLANITLKIWNSSNALYYNITNNLTGTANQTNFSLTNMSEDTYSWNCLSADIEGNSAYAPTNFSLTIGGVSTILVSPPTENYTKINDTNFSCQVSSDAHHELSNVTFYLWNESGNLTYNLTSLISGFTNTTTFNYTFATEGNYSWNCLGVNNGSNESWGNSNFTIIYDITNPNISLLSEATTTSGATITWITNEPTNSSVSLNSGSWTNSSSYTTSHSITISGLSASTIYSYTAISCDRAGNCANSSDSFTTQTPAPSGGSSGSTSFAGGVSGPITYKATADDILVGYTKKLGVNEKINFSLFSFKAERHLLTIRNISTDYANLTIESDPIKLTLFIGQTEKLNLTSEDYYDTSIKLENITDGKAEITIKLISELIEKTIEPIIVKTAAEEEKVPEEHPWIVEVILLDVVLGVTVIVLIVIAIRLFEKQSKKLKRRMTAKKKKNGKNKKT